MQRLVASLVLALSAPLWSATANAQPSHAIAMQGEPSLAADFAHLPYANPDAPARAAVSTLYSETTSSRR